MAAEDLKARLRKAKLAERLNAARAAQKPEVGPIEGLARGVASGSTLYFADEIEGAIRAIGDDTYEEGVSKARARNEASPTAARIGGELLGALLLPGLGTGAAIAKGATTGARMLRGAGLGAAEGAVAGFGVGEGDAVERLPSAATGAALGLPLGALGGRLTRPAQEASEFGIPLTKGQMSGDFAQLAKEETLRKSKAAGTNTIRAFDEVQRKAVGEATEGIVEGADSTALAASRAAEATKAGERALKSEVRQAYKAFEETEGFLRKEAGDDLLARLTDVMDNPKTGRSVNPDIRKQTQGTLDEIRDLMTPKSGPAGDVEHITLQQAEGVRKSINSAIDGAQGEYRAAMTAIKREFDDWLQNAVDSALYSGDDTALAKIKEARGLSSRYQSIFGRRSGDAAGKIIGKLADDNATPEEAINALFGMRKLSKIGTAGAIRRIEKVAPEAIDHLRQAGWSRLTQERTGDLKSAHQIAKGIKEQINEAPELMNALYGKDTVAKMGRFSDELQKTATPRDAVNNSNTFNRLSEFLRQKLGIASFAAETALTASAGMPTFGIGTLLAKGGLAAKDYATAKAATNAAKKRLLPRGSAAAAAGTAIPTLTSQNSALWLQSP